MLFWNYCCFLLKNIQELKSSFRTTISFIYISNIQHWCMKLCNKIKNFVSFLYLFVLLTIITHLYYYAVRFKGIIKICKLINRRIGLILKILPEFWLIKTSECSLHRRFQYFHINILMWKNNSLYRKKKLLKQNKSSEYIYFVYMGFISFYWKVSSQILIRKFFLEADEIFGFLNSKYVLPFLKRIGQYQ